MPAYGSSGTAPMPRSTDPRVARVPNWWRWPSGAPLKIRPPRCGCRWVTTQPWCSEHGPNSTIPVSRRRCATCWGSTGDSGAGVDQAWGPHLHIVEHLGLVGRGHPRGQDGVGHVAEPGVGFGGSDDKRDVPHASTGCSPLLVVGGRASPVLAEEEGQMGFRLGEVLGIHVTEPRIGVHFGVKPIDQGHKERFTSPSLVGVGLRAVWSSHRLHAPTLGRPRISSSRSITGYRRPIRRSTVFEWSEEQLMVRDTIRRFIEAEVVPHIDELEHGDLPPYDIIRKLYATFGMDQMARDRFKIQLDRKRDGDAAESPVERAEGRGDGGAAAMTLILIVELCHYCPGIVTAMGVSVGLAAGTIMKQGTPAQMERWGLDLLTMDKVGAWAITEPDSGSDRLGGMKAPARRDGDEYILNGNKPFITNGPYADTIVFYAKLDDGSDTPIRDRKVLTFVLDRGMPGLDQSKPFRKMGLHSSPTGELFLSDVRVGKDHLLGETEDEKQGSGRDSAKGNFVTERAGVAAMSLGLIEECLKLSVAYARDRMLWGQRIGDRQLIQLKLAKMEIARLNVQNLVFRHIELSAAGKSLTLAEASAMKLYSAQAASEVAMEAVQLFGGNGYMAEFRVEQLARDAKVFQIYAGTDEIQVTHIAKDLLNR